MLSLNALLPQKTVLKSSGKYKMIYIANAFRPDCFGECLRILQDKLNCRNFYAFNPSFDKKAR